jgi:hypothetical protein
LLAGGCLHGHGSLPEHWDDLFNQPWNLACMLVGACTVTGAYLITGMIQHIHCFGFCGICGFLTRKQYLYMCSANLCHRPQKPQIPQIPEKPYVFNHFIQNQQKT